MSLFESTFGYKNALFKEKSVRIRDLDKILLVI